MFMVVVQEIFQNFQREWFGSIFFGSCLGFDFSGFVCGFVCSVVRLFDVVEGFENVYKLKFGYDVQEDMLMGQMVVFFFFFGFG